MILKKTVTALALVMVASAMCAAGSTEVMAGGYGYGNSHSWSGNQNYKPKRRTAHRQVYAGNNRHLAWCYSRYRSYRLTDNTFQPYEGPRRECLSPYEQERRALFVGYPGEAPEILFRDQAGGIQVERDRFGNAPEGGAADPLSSGETAPSTDAFGNLPEQAVARDAVTPAADAPQAGAPAEGPVLKVPSADTPAAEPQEAASADGPEIVSDRPAETAATPDLQDAPAENGQTENAKAENAKPQNRQEENPQVEDAPAGETASEVPVD